MLRSHPARDLCHVLDARRPHPRSDRTVRRHRVRHRGGPGQRLPRGRRARPAAPRPRGPGRRPGDRRRGLVRPSRLDDAHVPRTTSRATCGTWRSRPGGGATRPGTRSRGSARRSTGSSPSGASRRPSGTSRSCCSVASATRRSPRAAHQRGYGAPAVAGDLPQGRAQRSLEPLRLLPRGRDAAARAAVAPPSTAGPRRARASRPPSGSRTAAPAPVRRGSQGKGGGEPVERVRRQGPPGPSIPLRSCAAIRGSSATRSRNGTVRMVVAARRARRSARRCRRPTSRAGSRSVPAMTRTRLRRASACQSASCASRLNASTSPT